MEENISEKLTRYKKDFVKLKSLVFPRSDEQFMLNYKNIPDRVNADEETEKIANKKANDFFEMYGIGNAKTGIDRPFERMEAYELLFDILITIDAKQFKNIHKGTPYYFLGWTTFQLRDFPKAMFYMDAAVNEDLKIPYHKNKKKATTPALASFLLSTSLESGIPISGSEVFHSKLIEIFEQTIKEYNQNNGKSKITIEDFRNKFIEILLFSDPEQRTLLTALYTFLLEYPEKGKQIKLRSDTGGSIQPFINHLFDGARLLESLLEKKGANGTSLKRKIDDLRKRSSNLSVTSFDILFKKDFTKGKWSYTLAEAKQKYIELSNDNFQDQNFACAYIIRNTTGHSLLWADLFDEETYRILYNSLVYAIFWTIDRLWLH